jgi:hypothetical protein
MCEFAVFADGAGAPAGVFEDLEDALVWALDRFGADGFTIRHWRGVLINPAPPPAAHETT